MKSNNKQLTNRMLNFKRDENFQLIAKYFNKKYFDYRMKIVDVLVYRDMKKLEKDRYYFRNRCCNYDFIAHNYPYKDSQLPF